MNFVKYSMDNRKVIFFFLIILIVGGISAFEKLAKKEDSPFVIKQAVVMTSYPGATPLEVEQLVTEIIERDVQTMPYMKYAESESYYGLSIVNVVLQDYTPADEIPQMWDVLRRKMLTTQQKLPKEAVIAINDDFGSVYGIYYALVADDGFTYSEMHDWTERLRRGISTVDGVEMVSIVGDQQPVINVYISLSKVANLGVDPLEIMNIIASQNKMVSSGTIDAGEMNVRLYADGNYQTIEDIQNQVITTKEGTQVKLGDIADIEKGYEEPARTLMTVNKKRAIGIGISTPADKDVVKTGNNVKAFLSTVMHEMPIGMELVTLYPEDKIAREANKGFIINLIESIVIVIFILMLVMGFKASVLIGSSLLFSIGGTMLIMQYMGVGLNRTSLAGFIIAMGMLVDNAIVVTDNAQVNMKRGMSKYDAFLKGAKDPLVGLLGATIIAIASFLPLYTGKSSTSEIVQPLFVVIGISLALSWILALSQTPLFGIMMFKEPKKDEENKDPYDTKMYKKFESILSSLIKYRWKTSIITIFTLLLSLFVMGLLPQSFFPNMDKEYFRADCFFPSGYSINDVNKDMSDIESYLMTQEGIKNVSITMGCSPPRYYLASASYGGAPNFANILVEVSDKKYTVEMEDNMNTYVRSNYPNIIIRSSLFKLSPQPDAEIEIGYIGPNIDTLTMLTTKVQDIMRSSGQVDQVRHSWNNKIPILRPRYSQEKGQRLGVSRQVMAQNITIATTGLPLGRFLQNDQFLPILMKNGDSGDVTMESLSTLPIFTNKGEVVPLRQVTESISLDYDFSVIRRYERERMMLAQAEPMRGANPSEAFKSVYDEVNRTIPVPEGYKMKVMGVQEKQEESNAALAAELPMTFIIIFLTLLLLFRTYKKPIVIIMMLPLIFIGVTIGLGVLDKSFDFFSLLGLLGLIGMNIKNAIVLVDQIGLEQELGKDPLRAVIDATKSRIVPVTMAAGTTILGMIPLLPDAMFGGMAATIMGGLFVATILTIFILPVTYCIMLGIRIDKK